MSATVEGLCQIMLVKHNLKKIVHKRKEYNVFLIELGENVRQFSINYTSLTPPDKQRYIKVQRNLSDTNLISSK